MELDDYYDVETKEALAKEFAILKLGGMSVNGIAKKLNMSFAKAKLFNESVEVSYFVKQIGNDAVKDFKSKLMQEVSKLVPLMIDTLKVHLEDHNLNAIPHALKIMGFDKEEIEQAQQITVVLPGEKNDKTATISFGNEKQDTKLSVSKETRDKLNTIEVEPVHITDIKI